VCADRTAQGQIMGITSDDKQETGTVIDVKNAEDRNVIKTRAGKILNYKDLKI
jgi:hypothetical protein